MGFQQCGSTSGGDECSIVERTSERIVSQAWVFLGGKKEGMPLQGRRVVGRDQHVYSEERVETSSVQYGEPIVLDMQLIERKVLSLLQ